MGTVEAYLRQKHGMKDLSKQVMEKKYQETTLTSRRFQFNESRRTTRDNLMLQRRNIEADCISPYVTPSKKGNTMAENNKARVAPGGPAKLDRLAKLKKWKEEKERKKMEEKKSAKPIFKVCHVPSTLGLPNYERVNKEIKGKLVKALIKPKTFKTQKPQVPATVQTSNPSTTGPIAKVPTPKLNKEKAKKPAGPAPKNKTETLKIPTVAEEAINDQALSVMTISPIRFTPPSTRRVTRSMSLKLPKPTDQESSRPANVEDQSIKSSPVVSKRKSRKTPRRSKSLDHADIENASPEIRKLQTSVHYVSPFVCVSRGKDARREYKERRANGGSIPGVEMTSATTGAHYFTSLLQQTTARIQNMREEWSLYKEAENTPEEAKEMIDVALGQSQLLLTKKFKQFSKLIERCLSNNTAEQQVTCMDLHGFWDMMSMQVEDIDKRFNNLTTMKSNAWQEVLPERAPAPKQKRGKKGKQPQASSKIRDAIRQARNRQKQAPVTPTSNGDSPGLAMMRLSQSIKKNGGVTPGRSILKSEGKGNGNKSVLFDLSNVRASLNFDVEGRGGEGLRKTPRRSRRLSTVLLD